MSKPRKIRHASRPKGRRWRSVTGGRLSILRPMMTSTSTHPRAATTKSRTFQVACRSRGVGVARTALAFVPLIAATGKAEDVKLLLNAHAHFDYWHNRPLFDALERGFTSVEADIFLVEGTPLVAHAREELST